ncbi:hypothetical protein [Arthrospiribacter ruber]|uniref:Uncharacterized protein n=1 Tax=Arthrospiribacter ruber TaxID=2487934 RepID=A0A951IXM0_9BACT|nr:hypothetical protein [Arthrospiribacter ruber]MBW3467912.1 hypothetical protein [Arthrospiribacter ruber]
MEDSFDFTWYYGENGDGDLYGTLENGSSFSFESKLLRASQTMVLLIEPSKKFTEEKMFDHTSQCFNFEVTVAYTGKNFKTEKAKIGRSEDGSFLCEDGTVMFLTNISLQ